EFRRVLFRSEPRGPHALDVRQDEPHWPDDVRRRGPEHLALRECLVHEPELVVLEIAKPAMDELGRRRGSARCKIVHFAQDYRIAAADGVPCDPRAVNAASDNEDVVGSLRSLTHGVDGPASAPATSSRTPAVSQIATRSEGGISSVTKTSICSRWPMRTGARRVSFMASAT